MARHHRNPRCAVNVALEVIGDPWSLLVVRDIVFYGKHSFREFLASEEGVTTSVLADRLATLVAQGVLTKRRSPIDRRQQDYELTEKGLSLIPVLIDLGTWGAQYGPQVTKHETWDHEARHDPTALRNLVRDTVMAGGSAFRGPNSVLQRLELKA